MERPRLVLATHNVHKVGELVSILAEYVPGVGAPGAVTDAGTLGVPDVVEDGISFSANALLKARAVAFHTGLPAIADDSGLCVDVMGGAPGIFSARWAGRHGDDEANLRLLLDQLSDIEHPNRRAWFECAAALVLPDGGEKVEIGRMPGVLARSPRGDGGFGYDPILIPDGETRTSAELSAVEKNAISHRGRALRALAPAISQAMLDGSGDAG